MALIEPRRDYAISPAPGAGPDLDALPLVKAAIDRGQVRRGDIERVVKLMKPEMLDEMADAVRSFQAAGPRREHDAGRDLAERERIAREFGDQGIGLEDVAELSREFSSDPDVAERQRIAREYGMRLEDVS